MKQNPTNIPRAIIEATIVLLISEGRINRETPPETIEFRATNKILFL